MAEPLVVSIPHHLDKDENVKDEMAKLGLEVEGPNQL
jgi:hypothetical protein